MNGNGCFADSLTICEAPYFSFQNFNKVRIAMVRCNLCSSFVKSNGVCRKCSNKEGVASRLHRIRSLKGSGESGPALKYPRYEEYACQQKIDCRASDLQELSEVRSTRTSMEPSVANVNKTMMDEDRDQERIRESVSVLLDCYSDSLPKSQSKHDTLDANEIQLGTPETEPMTELASDSSFDSLLSYESLVQGNFVMGIPLGNEGNIDGHLSPEPSLSGDEGNVCSDDDDLDLNQASSYSIGECRLSGFSGFECTENGVHSATDSFNVCCNCKRMDIPCDNEDICVVLSNFPVAEVTRYEKKWITFDPKLCESSVLLCVECIAVLSKEERRKRRSGNKTTPWRYLWPVYMWKLVTHPNMLLRFGIGTLHWIPATLLDFWEHQLVSRFPDYYDASSISAHRMTVAVVTDVTEDIGKFKGILSRNKIGELKRGCNQYLMPRILCPWGCTAYLHDYGYVSYDAVISRLFPAVEFAGTIASASERARVYSCRSDYLSFEIDCHLYNPNWSVHPSVEFVSGKGPLLLTCDTHANGTTQQYFHLPKSSTCIPASNPDILSHAVINTNVIHRTKAFQYSTTYQMNKCTGSYSGVECSYVSENRHFDFISHLTDVNEARSYAGRIDIRGLVGRLKGQNLIPDELADGFAERATDLFSDGSSLGSLASGATMITLHDAIKLQGMLSTHPTSTIVVDSDSHGNLYTADRQIERTIRRQWPTNLIWIHQNDTYGGRIRVLPAMHSRMGEDFRILWNVCHILLNTGVLWEQCTLGQLRTSDWKGFLLAYLSRNILGQTVRDKQFKGDPFDLPSTDPRNKPSGLYRMLEKYCIRHGGDGYRFNNVDFSPGDIQLLFRDEIARGIVQCMTLVSAASTSVVVPDSVHGQEDCRVIITYRSGEERLRNRLPLVLSGVDGKSFEIRMLTASSSREKKKDSGYKSIWDSDVWMRHGTAAFPNWWYAKRSPLINPVTVDTLDNVCWENVDIAVYVRRETISVDQYRLQYLQYIGGQAKACCSEHDVPMIICSTKVAADDSKRSCSGECGTKCKRIPEYICPISECKSCICRECFKAIPAGSIRNIDPGTCMSQEDVTLESSNCDSSSDSDNSFGADDPADYPALRETQGCDSFDDECSVESDNEDPTSAPVHFLYGNIPTGAHCPGFGTGEYAPDYESDSEQHNNLIPTTLHSEDQNVLEGTSELIGTSVLLNKCGTMLVRRTDQLQTTRRERTVIERIASKRDIGTVPLIYLEGILFPSIFWCLSHSCDGGILGSMPTSFFCQTSTRKRFGVASLADHAKTRLKSVGNASSTDPRYLTFLFDSIANGAIEGSDTRVVLSRGFEESMGPAGMRVRNKDDNLYSDTIDNRQCVHDLCGAQREDEFDVFVTLTCNQREHFGIRNIKRYIDDGEALQRYKDDLKRRFPNEKKLSASACAEVQRSLQEASMNLTVRNWMEIRKILIQYILHSNELPLGSKVNRIFVRDEYQGDAGNLAHLHLIVSLAQKYSTDEGKRAVESVIRGFVDEIVGVDEVQGYIAEGILDDWEDYETMKQQARTYLSHHCSDRCMRRTGPNPEDVKCRVPDARLISPDVTKFCEVSMDTIHSDDAIRVMERIGLCKKLSDTEGLFVPTKDYLVSKRIYAPVRHGEGNISPVVGRIFAATRSTMNIQICTSNGTSRYVVKYIIKIDENNYIVMKANQKENEANIKAEKVFLCNTKVSSSALNEKKKLDASRHRKRNKGRAIASTEMMQLLLGFPQVHTNMEFIRIPTVPLGERPGIERETPQDLFDSLGLKTSKDAFSVMVPMVSLRQTKFGTRQLYRRHTESQVSMLRDQMLSKVTLDRVFVFSIRPPELLFVDKMEWYYRIFERRKFTEDGCSLGDALTNHLSTSLLIDGLGFQLRIRPLAIPLLEKVLTENPNRFMPASAFYRVKHLFLKIVKYFNEVGLVGCDSDPNDDENMPLSKNGLCEWRKLQQIFMAVETPLKPLPVIVCSNVKPCNATKFVIHLMLSMGHFITERDLWMHPSMAQAFQASSLIDAQDDSSMASKIDKLLYRWIEDQLRYYPITSKRVDEYIVAADTILQAVLVDNAIPISEIPPVMYTSLVRDTTDKINRYMIECKRTLVEATLKSVSSAYENATALFPSTEELLSATKENPVLWDHMLPKTERQSDASYVEQIATQKRTADHIDTYCHPHLLAAKNLLIAGPPGVGKTHCLGHGILYGLCKGLTLMTTAMLADRAFVLGGKHIHKLFKLRVRDSGTPHRLAELAIISLQKKPELFQFIRRLDILFIDECGQVSAELLSTLDIIVRKVRDSSLFMGGIMVIGTIDQVQLRPINGLPFLLSPYILTTFSIVVLKQYVRCADCTVLQEMNELARTFPRSEDEWRYVKRRIRLLIKANCTFVDAWDDPLITDSVLRIFPRREETYKAVESFLERKKKESSSAGSRFLSVEAEDMMIAMESHSDWKPATRQVSTYLNSKLKEPESIHFFVGAIYQFTHNSPGKFNATQLGILTTMPDPSRLRSFEDIEILVAPPGTKSIDTSNLPTENTPGWSITTVGVAPHTSVNLWNHGVKARRRQYSLRHHIASTIHSAIGHSVSAIATELGNGRDMWEKAMVVVLISRVSEAKDLIFVGDKTENIDSIIRALCIRNQYDEYMNHIVNAISGTVSRGHPNTLSLQKHPFRQKDIPIPDDTSGMVYLLVSLKDPFAFYVGMTQDMNRRLKQHNSGYGASTSSDPNKRPWGLMAYVTGFQGNRSEMRTFELRWQNAISSVKPDNCYAAASLATLVIDRYYSGSDLLLVSMGSTGDPHN